jgi:heat shock protein HslJ
MVGMHDGDRALRNRPLTPLVILGDMTKSVAVALAVVMALSGCMAESEEGSTTSESPGAPSAPVDDPTTSTTQPEFAFDAIEGIWMLTSYDVDGTVGKPEVGVNTASIPWIQFTSHHLTGEAGCNDFSTDIYSLDAGQLRPEDVGVTMALCTTADDSADLMAVENLFVEFLDGDVVLVAIVDQHLKLTEGENTLSFEAIDSVPDR